MEPALREATTGLLRQEYPQQTELGPSFAHNRLLSELLVQLEAADAVRRTIELLNSSSAQEEQMHFLYVLRNVREGWSPQDRDAYFAGLSRAQHYLGGAGMSDFLDRIRAEAVATLDPFERQRLGGLIDGQAPAEETVRSGPRQVVRQWTVDQLWDEAADLWQQADPARGAGVFAAAACIQCHRFGSRGTLIGPDLTSARGRYSRRDLLVAMLEPSSVIAENYRSLQIVTLDGKTYTGQATLGGDYRSQMLRLATDPAQPLRTIEVPKTEIESQRWSDVSWMPSGLLDSFTSAEIVDLVSYLESAPR
jgi:putative heme-binding domain-containing protein